MKGITDIDEGTIRRVDWQELLPITTLVRTFPRALRVSTILFSTIAVLIAFFVVDLAGWTFNEYPYLNGPISVNLDSSDLERPVSAFLRYPFWNFAVMFQRQRFLTPDYFQTHEKSDPTTSSMTVFSVYATHLLNRTSLEIVLLAFFAICLARSTAVSFASSRRSSLGESFWFAFKQYKSFILAIFLLGTGILVFSLLIDLASWGTGKLVVCNVDAFSFIFVPLIIVFSFSTTFLFWGLILTLPLIVAAIATNKSDGYDAISRSFSYICQRPLHFIVYSTFAIALGAIGSQIVYFFALQFSLVLNLLNPPLPPFEKNLVLYLIGYLPTGFLFGWFVVSSTVVYFLLRRSVDGTAFDVFAENAAPKVRRLKPILQDAQGAPIVPGETSIKPSNESSKSESVPNELERETEDESKREPKTNETSGTEN